MKKPDYLPDYPKAPEGYHWEYRGLEWKAENVRYIFTHRGSWGSEAWIGLPCVMDACKANGHEGTHYVELVEDGEETEPLINEIRRQAEEATKLVGETVQVGPISFKVENVSIHLLDDGNLSFNELEHLKPQGFCVTVSGENNRVSYTDVKLVNPVKVNGYEARDGGDYYEFGCAKISKTRLRLAKEYLSEEHNSELIVSNRKVESVKIGEGEFTLDILNQLDL